MKATYITVVIVVLLCVVCAAKLFYSFRYFGMFVVMPGSIMLVAKGVKRLKGGCKEYNSHKCKVKYCKLSFHYRKGREKEFTIATRLQLKMY